MKWKIHYYSDKVQKTIEKWPIGVRAFYAKVTERMAVYGPNLGMPFTRELGAGLFEIRARGKEGVGRAFFCTVRKGNIVILHAFQKKTQKTPQQELEVARRRLQEVQNEDA